MEKDIHLSENKRALHSGTYIAKFQEGEIGHTRKEKGWGMYQISNGTPAKVEKGKLPEMKGAQQENCTIKTENMQSKGAPITFQ